jgi:hypothetical protein
MKQHYYPALLSIDEYYSFLNIVGDHPEFNNVDVNVLFTKCLVNYAKTNPFLNEPKHHLFPTHHKVTLTIDDPYLTKKEEEQGKNVSNYISSLVDGFFHLPTKEEEAFLFNNK